MALNFSPLHVYKKKRSLLTSVACGGGCVCRTGKEIPVRGTFLALDEEGRRGRMLLLPTPRLGLLSFKGKIWFEGVGRVNSTCPILLV